MSILTRITLSAQHVRLFCSGRLGLTQIPQLSGIFAHVRGSRCRIRSRCISSSIGTVTRQHRTIELPIGVSGRIRLDLLSPLDPRARQEEPRHVLVYLPPGPSISTLPTENLSMLADVAPANASLVNINYRLRPDLETQDESDQTHCFPIPIHDVSTAFDYLTSSTSPFNEGYDEPPKIGLLGSHIGGALATMLALTEPNHVHALAAIQPMVDWVGLDEVVEQLRATKSTPPPMPKKGKRQKGTARYGADNESVLRAAEELTRLRARLFKTPSAYFDPFASPLLFLRAPGRDTPLGSSMADQVASEWGLDDIKEEDPDRDSSFGPYDDDWQARPSSPQSIEPREHTASNGFSAVQSLLQPQRPTRRRKVLRRWPSVGQPESVMLPYTTVFVQAAREPDSESEPPALDLARGHAALMRSQGADLVELMRRACFLGRDKSFAEERVHLQVLGDQSPVKAGGGPGDQSMDTLHESAAKWLAEMFDRE